MEFFYPRKTILQENEITMGSLSFKIVNGTRPDGRRLCDSSCYSVVMRGAAESQEMVYCSYMQRTVTMSVVECNRYCSTVDPTLEDMQKIAVMLRSDMKRLNIGFGKSKETTSKE